MTSIHNGNSNSNMNQKEFHVAPMMGITTREFRYFIRLLSRHAVLWTEMIVDDTILHANDLDHHLGYDTRIEPPVVCQVGGHQPSSATRVTRIVTHEYGYREINLNAGCPSHRVASERAFGAALMVNVQNAVDMLQAMQRGIRPTITNNNTTHHEKETTTQPVQPTQPIQTTRTRRDCLPHAPQVSIKLRIGVDDCDDLPWTVQLIRQLSSQGKCKRFYIHARKVHTQGLDPAQNRRIPPLNYPRVYELCRIFPDCEFWINGGIATLAQAREICYGIQSAPSSSSSSSSSSIQSNHHHHDQNDQHEDNDDNIIPSGHGVIPCPACQLPYGSCTTAPCRAPTNLRGCMVGRAIVDNPMSFATLDTDFYGDTHNPSQTRRQVLEKYADYLITVYPRRCGDCHESITTRPFQHKHIATQAQQLATNYSFYCPLCTEGDPSHGQRPVSSASPPRLTRHVIGRALKPVQGAFCGMPGLAKAWKHLLQNAMTDKQYWECGPSFALRRALIRLQEKHPHTAAKVLDAPFVKEKEEEDASWIKGHGPLENNNLPLVHQDSLSVKEHGTCFVNEDCFHTCHVESITHKEPSDNKLLTQTLLGWSSLTTRLLREGRTSSSWNILDEPLGPDFHMLLQSEFDRAGVWGKMRPSKTNSDVMVNELAKILSANALSADVVPNQRAALAMLGNAFAQNQDVNSTRGDQSVFLTRALRSQPNFALDHPVLCRLVQLIESTVAMNLETVFEFDFSLTSVQVAEYPGDGLSGYTRHCDRGGNMCREEEFMRTHLRSNNNTSGRLLTVLYYLTPNDWDARLDGGALRIFHSMMNYTDVVPYPNRMVIFRSDCVEHEVRPSLRRPRRAVTIWLYGKVQLGHDATMIDSASEEAGRTETNVTASAEASWTGPPPLPFCLTIAQGSPSIFVSMAAFRDPETGPTLRDLVEKAAFPQRIFVGLVLQIDTEKDQASILDLLPVDEPWYKTNVRMIQLHSRHATGPCPARAMAQLLLRDEEFVLQIDSHTRFRQNWDVYLMQELEACPTKMALLTTYPVGYQLPNNIPNETRGTLLYPWKFDSDGMLRQKACLMEKKAESPALCSLFAAGFCFGRRSWVTDCPYDGSLHHLFFGEEISMALRLYTAGYDMYAPRECVCYHLWSRSHRPPANPICTKTRKASLETIKLQMQHGQGLGSLRTREEWASQVGVDLNQNKIIFRDRKHDLLSMSLLHDSE